MDTQTDPRNRKSIAIPRTGSLFFQLAGSLAFGLSALPLLVLMYLGTFTRYLADDYSTSGIISNLGFWKAQSHWYQYWSGRYAFTFTISLVETAGVVIVRWLPALGLLAWAALTFWTLRKIFKILGLSLPNLWLGVLINVLIYGTIKSFHQYAQVIFWQTGILTYLISLILITLAAGVFLERFCGDVPRRPSPLELILWFAAFFVMGGFSETWVVVQISMLGPGLVFVFFGKSPRRGSILGVLASGLAASLLSLLVIARAPGNMYRDAVTSELSIGLLWNSIWKAFQDVPLFLSAWLDENTAIVSMLVLAGLFAGLFSTSLGRQSRLKTGLALVVGAYVLLWAGFAPNFAVMGVRPVERAIFMTMFLFISALTLFFVLAGYWLAERLPPAGYSAALLACLVGLVLMLVWVPVRGSLSLYSLIPDLRLYARYWDARDAYLRQAAARGETDVIVDSLRRNPELRDLQTTFWIEGDLQDAPDHWVNQAAASYYGLASITLRR